MRIKYIGTHEAGVEDFPGLWQPGQEQDVSKRDGKYLLGSSQFIEVATPPDEVPVDVPVPDTPTDQVAAPTVPTDHTPTP